MTDIFLLPSDATARLLWTRCTDCGACTTPAAFNAGSEFRLLAVVDRAPDVARGPRALRDGCPSQTKASQSFEQTLSSQKIWKSLQTTPVHSRSEAPVGQPQAGAAAHACTECAARTASAEPSGLCASPPCPAPFRNTAFRPLHAARRCGEAARRNRGVRGELFPPHCLSCLSGAAPRLLRPVPFLFPAFPAFSAFTFRAGAGRFWRGRGRISGVLRGLRTGAAGVFCRTQRLCCAIFRGV